MRALLDDRPSQLALGLFGATFVQAIMTLREVRDEGPGGGSVPGVSVLVAYALMLGSVVALILYVNHAGQSLRASGLIDLVGDSSRELIDRFYPAEHVGSQPDPDVVLAPRPGVVVGVDHAALVESARRAGCRLELIPMIGDFVPGGAPLFRISGSPATLDRDAVARLVVVGSERVHAEDPAYGIRKLVDIAERSIAQQFNDPTTALQALHRIHDLLRQLAPRPFPSGVHRDESGEVRLLTRVMDWDGYVRLAFDEIRLAGAGTPQIARRLRAALEDLKTVAPAERQAALDRQLQLLSAAVRREYEDPADVSAALTPDVQGIGSGADVSVAGRNGHPQPAGVAAPQQPLDDSPRGASG